MISYILRSATNKLLVEIRTNRVAVNTTGDVFSILYISGATDAVKAAGFTFRNGERHSEQEFIDFSAAHNLTLERQDNNVTIVEGNREVTRITALAEGSVKQVTSLEAIAEGSVKESDKFTFLTEAGTATGDFFIFYYTATLYAAVWLDKTGDGATDLPSGPIFSGATVTIAVDVHTGVTTAINMAAAVTTALGLNATITAACTITDNLDGSINIVNKSYIAVGGAPATHNKGETTAGTIVTVRTATGTPSALLNNYGYISSKTTDYAFWFKVSGTGSDPALGGKTSIEVDIARGDSAATVGTAVAAALLAVGGSGAVFTTSGTSIVLATHVVYGVPKTASGAGTSGFAVTVQTAGHGSNTSGTYLKLNNTYGKGYYVWINVTGLSSSDPAPAGRTAIEATIAQGAAASTIATAMALAIAAIDAGSVFETSASSTHLDVTDAVEGTATDAVDGSGTPTGFAIAITTQGSGDNVRTSLNAYDSGSALDSAITYTPSRTSNTGNYPNPYYLKDAAFNIKLKGTNGGGIYSYEILSNNAPSRYGVYVQNQEFHIWGIAGATDAGADYTLSVRITDLYGEQITVSVPFSVWGS